MKIAARKKKALKESNFDALSKATQASANVWAATLVQTYWRVRLMRERWRKVDWRANVRRSSVDGKELSAATTVALDIAVHFLLELRSRRVLAVEIARAAASHGCAPIDLALLSSICQANAASCPGAHHTRPAAAGVTSTRATRGSATRGSLPASSSRDTGRMHGSISAAGQTVPLSLQNERSVDVEASLADASFTNRFHSSSLPPAGSDTPPRLADSPPAAAGTPTSSAGGTPVPYNPPRVSFRDDSPAIRPRVACGFSSRDSPTPDSASVGARWRRAAAASALTAARTPSERATAGSGEGSVPSLADERRPSLGSLPDRPTLQQVVHAQLLASHRLKATDFRGNRRPSRRSSRGSSASRASLSLSASLGSRLSLSIGGLSSTNSSHEESARRGGGGASGAKAPPAFTFERGPVATGLIDSIAHQHILATAAHEALGAVEALDRAENTAIVALQAKLRGRHALYDYVKLRRNIILVQAAWRAHLARARLRLARSGRKGSLLGSLI